MIIELHGGNFKNKGAQLMLMTAVYELSQRVDDIDFVIGTTSGEQEQLKAMGLREVFPVRPWMNSKYYRLYLYVQEFFSLWGIRKVVGQFGKVTLGEADVLVDISGFAFTDHFGSKPAVNFGALCESYQRKGKPVVMLPQAFGPFNTSISQKAFRKVLDHVDLLFARDKKSVEYIESVTDQEDFICHAPDITLFYPPQDEIHTDQDKYCCIIPSERMFDQGKYDWGTKYIKLLEISIEQSLRHAHRVFIVVHDVGDYAIAKHLTERYRSKGEVSLFWEEDPVITKRFIGKSSYVVGSRYHGIIAAFSYGVPALCMGWAHKYNALYRDFGVEEFLITPEATQNSVIEKLQFLGSPTNNQEIKNLLLRRLEELYAKNQMMWDSVVKTIT